MGSPPRTTRQDTDAPCARRIRSMTCGTSGGSTNVLARLGLRVNSDDRIGVAGVTDPVTDTAQAGTATNWFLASSGANTIEVGYVSGRNPVLRQSVLAQGKWGLNFDIKHDIGAKALDYRGLHKSTGAA